MKNQVEKYKKTIRILHWVHTGAFVLLFLTGLVLYVPGLGFLAEDSWTRILHRLGAVIFIIAPLAYSLLDWKGVVKGIKQALAWGKDDVNWLKAAPRYYFLNDESGMPPQGSMNTGQKMWWFVVLVFGLLFVLTGLIMWFAKEVAPAGLLQWMTILHDISFIVSGAMLFVHIYLAAFHPMMKEAMGSMTHGKISVHYAKSHHGKWYDQLPKGKNEKA